MASLPRTYKAAVLHKADAQFVIEDRPLKMPGKGEILVKILACGVCGTDEMSVKGRLWGQYPMVIGHEMVGDIAAVGEGGTRFKLGDRVGGAWHGGHDLTCRTCQRGQFQLCDNGKVNGVSFDGGYAEYAILRTEATVRVPKTMDPTEAGPLLCAGVTTFNSIRKMHIEQGNLVAIQGLGGLGHLAVQFASKMGYTVAALSSGSAKRNLAAQLGAHHYIDTRKENAAETLQALGGAALIVATAPIPDATTNLLYGLQARGKLLVLPAFGPVPFDTGFMIRKSASVHGWASGHALDSEETIAFAQTHGVKCMIEKFPLADVQKAYDAMIANKVHFRAVLTM